MEFYRRLRDAGAGDHDAYWPEPRVDSKSALQPNPRLEDCNLLTPIPYLWWALRAADPSTHGVGGDAIGTYDHFLLPHLASLLIRARMKSAAITIGKAWLDVGVDFVTSELLHIDTFISIGKGIFETAKVFSDERGARSREALAHSKSRADAVLADLRKVYDPSFWAGERTPGIIFIDDAQFIHEDAALPHFIERLLHTAFEHRWPILILVAHWKQELAKEEVQPESFAAVLRHALRGSKNDRNRATGLPGGFVPNANYTEIDVRPLTDLSSAVCEVFPGVGSVQREALLERVGGNPRYLEQVLAYLRERAELFEGLDTKRALTPEGLQEILKAASSQQFFRFLRERLRAIPEDVRDALCLASLQGTRFSNELVDASAIQHLGLSLRAPLGLGENPFNLVAGTRPETRSDVGEFVDGLFHHVAEDLSRSLRELRGAAALSISLKTAVKSVAEETGFSERASVDARLIVYGLAAKLLERSDDPEERASAQRALGEIADIQLSRSSKEAAAATYERLLVIAPSSYSFSQWDSRIRTWEVLATLYQLAHWPAKRSRALNRMLTEAFNWTGMELFLHSAAPEAVVANFASWKARNPDADPRFYLAAADAAIRGLLELSELARSWPDLPVAPEDDPVGIAPFFVRLGAEGESGEPSGLAYHRETSCVLRERAYNLGALFEPGIAERQHIRILGFLARQALIEGDQVACKDALERSLEIAAELGSELDEAQILSNLAGAAAQADDDETSERLLYQALEIVEPILNEETFPVGIGPAEDIAPAARNDAAVSVNVPRRFDKAFDDNPEGVVDTVLRLNYTAGQIVGNIALIALRNGRRDEAKRRFEKALAFHRTARSSGEVADVLQSLADIAASDNRIDVACGYWKECLDIYSAVQGSDILVAQARAAADRVRSRMLSAGCETSSS
jgi:tetratricopeptide (TPR) repeat protein